MCVKKKQTKFHASPAHPKSKHITEFALQNILYLFKPYNIVHFSDMDTDDIVF